MGTVAVGHLDGFGSSSKGEELVTHTDCHDRDLRAVHHCLEVLNRG